MNTNTPTFSIILASPETVAPKFYVGPDKSQEISCVQTGSDVACAPTETNMPSGGEYEIYYADACDNLQTTGIIVTYEKASDPNPEITIETKGGYLMYKFIIGGLLVLMF